MMMSFGRKSVGETLVHHEVQVEDSRWWWPCACSSQVLEFELSSKEEYELSRQSSCCYQRPMKVLLVQGYNICLKQS